MKIGIIVEGQEEQQSLRFIVAKLNIEGKQFLTPVFAPIEPKATPQQIVKATENRLKLLNKADKILVLIDMENVDQCPGERANTIKNIFHNKGYTNVEVVIKKHQFENWLIADPVAIGNLKTFSVTESFNNKIRNNADSVTDPVALLTAIKNDRRSFHKTRDGTAIAKEINIITVASNSRSFRRFLRLVEHPQYLLQSKNRVL